MNNSPSLTRLMNYFLLLLLMSKSPLSASNPAENCNTPTSVQTSPIVPNNVSKCYAEAKPV
jgi:hypothetical protein